ncbi:hypothetical protein SISNIDRAFT_461290 [Sistotremastrum niveocremeum HHB9708]|uniref:Extracellular metalloproteinase n=1 Tax=Sistotremastrum niveocremeum HHB9708 TaxID=1314777 RepID=A0A164MSC9_9AGAM|nr:hypothetical protein SISNIDRAFT_461290 [Sistotremastrum niveocremeum HHB9708]
MLSDLETNLDVYVDAMSVTSTDDNEKHTHQYFDNVPYTVSPVKGTPGYIQTAGGIKFAWKFEVQMQHNWYEAAVTLGEDGSYDVPFVADWTSDFSPSEEPSSSPNYRSPARYAVFPWGVNDPSEANRSVEYEREDPIASPVGWHTVFDNGTSKFLNLTTTLGNNVLAQENWEGYHPVDAEHHDTRFLDHKRPDAGEKLEFDYIYEPSPRDTETFVRRYINASISQLFYTANMYHDLLYHYGFNEEAGNFQDFNFGRRGKGRDAIIAYAQECGKRNNAEFSTPPDGYRPHCRMYLFYNQSYIAQPVKDSSFDTGVVIHELTHGVTSRLTGGPLDSSCLNSPESAGMNEGWSDFLATMLRDRVDPFKYDASFYVGAWAASNDTGIRKYPYTTDKHLNPTTYSNLNDDYYQDTHPKGTVWGQMLWEVAQNLVQKHGYNENMFPSVENQPTVTGKFYRPVTYNSEGKPNPLIPIHGNTLAIQLIIDAMKHQKCNPTFVDARTAILKADEGRTNRENRCHIWRGFAKRGLGRYAKRIGSGASLTYVEDFTIPPECVESS